MLYVSFFQNSKINVLHGRWGRKFQSPALLEIYIVLYLSQLAPPELG